MTEEKKPAEEEKPAEETPQEETPAPDDKITQANAAAIRIEEATAGLKKENDRLEALKVEQTLGGKTQAGTKTKTKEDEDDEAAKKLLAGTGYEEEIFKK